jgi:8-amino-7-oxononanoate synthase
MTQVSIRSDDPAHRAERPIDLTLAGELGRIRDAGLYRRLRCVESAQEEAVTIDGRRYLLFCSNNYLGLATHPRVVAAAKDALDRYGAGAVSSRLISGSMAPHAELERKLARWKGVERALVFSTGYQANVGAVTSLVGPEDTVFSDELNHASIIDGCRLSRAAVRVYRHNDVEHLERLLAEAAPVRRRLVVTESIFSMDGDLAPLADIVSVCERFGAWLAVDEAHAAGIFGPGGAGVAAELGLTDRVDVHIGTLGKALGSFGAYVAGSSRLVELLVNRARSFIFTTGLPPSAAAAAKAAIEICEEEPDRARGLLERARGLGMRLRDAGLGVPHADSQILPVVIGRAEETVAVAERLLDAGVYVAAIRPPTVPANTSRLRVSLMATHAPEDIAVAERAIVHAAGKAAAP